MLNRMVELATMSANGTYDNDTDRFQLQKEMDQLNSEIDRIADSANFNGIKLLDGSMDENGIVRGTEVAYNDGSPAGFQPYAGTASGVSKIAQPGNTLGVNTKVHIGKAYKAEGKTLDTSVEGYDLTLSTISIARQSDAAKAVDVIKAAINQVSDLRGTLGATQNRLDHTINNLSVMTENIQDAESTSRRGLASITANIPSSPCPSGISRG